MGSFSGMGTTFALANYPGELFLASPTDTPFLTAIGGLTPNAEDMIVTSTQFDWQTEDLAAPQQPAIIEGADPNFEERTRSGFSNVVQIFQYGVNVSYTKMAAFNQLANPSNGQDNPVQNELDHQIDLKLITAARDINYTFLRGAYAKPANNATGRKTRGLEPAITTNVVANGSAAALTKAMMDQMLQSVWDARGINQAMEPTLIVNAFQKRMLSKIYITDANYQELSREVGGVNLQQIETDFGRLNIMLERSAPSDAVIFAHLRVIKPKFLLIPGKGFLFLEPLAKTGASEKYQIYGEVGLAYGDEAQHGKITGLTTA